MVPNLNHQHQSKKLKIIMPEIPTQKIIRLKISNVKRLSAVEIHPDGNVVIIGGENEQGKSSILDSIVYALGGAGTIPQQPIRSGKTKAEIVLETTTFIVTRKFSASGGSSLVVTAKDGSPFKSPQSLLDELTGSLSFDPLDFSRLCEKEPKKAAEVLRQLAGLDFTKLDADRKAAYENRTLVGREKESIAGRLATFTHYPEAPKEEVSVEDITARLTAAQEHNKKATPLATAKATKESELSAAKNTTASVKKRLDEAKALVKKLETEFDAANKAEYQATVAADEAARELEKFEMVNEQPFIDEISGAEAINQKVRSNRDRVKINKELDAKVGEYETLTEQIEAFDKQKADLLEKAKFPTKDISFDESGVLLDGLPFVQGSTAQRIKASLAMGMALNPKLRVVLIREGSLLDKNSLALVCKMAVDADYQVWIERVGDGKECSIIIEDGAVKE